MAKIIKIECIVCHKEFEAKSSLSTFCPTCKKEMDKHNFTSKDIPDIDITNWTIKKTCQCGKVFMAKSGTTKYCPSCRTSKQRIAKAKKINKNKTWLDIAKEAKEHNMSYGKYVAYKAGMIPRTV